MMAVNLSQSPHQIISVESTTQNSMMFFRRATLDGARNVFYNTVLP